MRAFGVRRLRFGMELASLMARLLAGLAPRLGYLISKGGITTGTLLAEGLGLEAVQLEGQLLPGLSLVRAIETATDMTEPMRALPVITFPGNLGTEHSLKETWQMFAGEA